jgi:hypothetical protein
MILIQTADSAFGMQQQRAQAGAVVTLNFTQTGCPQEKAIVCEALFETLKVAPHSSDNIMQRLLS